MKPKYNQEIKSVSQLSIINRVESKRKLKGFTQAELAQLVGTTQQTISAIENLRWEPTLKLAMGISIILNEPIENLFYEAAPYKYSYDRKLKLIEREQRKDRPT